MEPSSRGLAEGQEPETATSLVCFCWVGVGHKSFCLQLQWLKVFPFHALSIHRRTLPLYPVPSSATIFSFLPQCLPFHHDPQLVLMHFLGIDLPILSVRAIMIRLWIISLDHCFPLLCWLGAIHLPPPPESQPLLNCLSHSPPLPSPLSSTSSTPVTPHDPHLSSFAPQHLLKSKLSWSQSQCWVFIGHSRPRKPLAILPSSHWPLPQQTAEDTSFLLVVKEVTKWQTGLPYCHRQLFMTEADWGDINKKGWSQFVTNRAWAEKWSSWFKGSYITPWGTICSDLLHLLLDNAPKLKAWLSVQGFFKRANLYFSLSVQHAAFFVSFHSLCNFKFTRTQE